MSEETRPQAGNNVITAVLGRKRQGKTTYIKQRIRSRLESKVPRVVILGDIRNDYAELKPLSVQTISDFQLASTNGLWNKPELFVRLKFTALEEYNIAAAILQHVKHYLLVLDEIDTYCSANFMPRHLQSLVLGSGNNSIDIMLAAKRSHMVPRLLTSQADEFIVFNHREKRDVDFVTEWVGENPPVPYFKLRRGQYLHYNGEEWQDLQLVLPPIQNQVKEKIA